MPTKRELEEIDRIVDAVLDDDEKAQELKRALHQTAENTAKPTVQDDAEQGEDIWDDVPV
jgi:TATA-binding protein-associated factor Taf7